MRAALDQLALAHHPQHSLLVHRPAQLPADPSGDQPVAVGRVALGDLNDRQLNPVDRWPASSLRCPARLGDTVDSLPADPQDARHDRRAMTGSDELTGVGDAQRHSPLRKPFPKISSS